ncbi:MAG: MtN3 and saliva related transmembrane protein [Alphaproteobacteria bacterium]|jgi:MtN3 and saliva related transmembrane protein
MNVLELVGFLAAFCTTISFLPQVIKVLKTRDTQSLSLGMYIFFVFGVLLWLMYGIAKQDWPIIAANAFTLVLANIILVIKVKNIAKDKQLDNSLND